MEKARTLIITVTAWISFLASLWLLAFDKVGSWFVLANTAMLIVVFGIVASGSSTKGFQR